MKQMGEQAVEFGQDNLGRIANWASIKLPDWYNISRLIVAPGGGVANSKGAHMVDVVRVKPPEWCAAGRFRRGGLAAFAPFSQKASSRCRSAAGAADGH